MWWDHDPGWGGWLVMSIGMGGSWILLAVLAWAVLRGVGREDTRAPDAREILQQRFARGEIDAEEYEARLQALTRPGP